MRQDKDLLVISADSGTCLSGLLHITLFFVFMLLWGYYLGNLVIEVTQINRAELPDFWSWPVLSAIFPGLFLHEFVHAVVIRLFGGQPRWRMREKEERDLSMRYGRNSFLFQSIAAQTWSEGTRFSLLQYLCILFSPIPATFIGLPLLMVLLPDPKIHGFLFTIGFINTLLIPRDLIASGLILYSAAFRDYDIVDKENGTYASPRR